MSDAYYEAAVGDGTAPPIAGDHSDDDAQVIESLFVETSEPPPINNTGIVVRRHEQPKRPTRLFGATYVIPPAAFNSDTANPWQEPIMLLPPDPNRVSITIRIVGPPPVLIDPPTGHTYWSFLFSDDPNNLTPQTAFGIAMASTTSLSETVTFTDHTGALWTRVYSSFDTGFTASKSSAVTCSVMAVSK